MSAKSQPIQTGGEPQGPLSELNFRFSPGLRFWGEAAKNLNWLELVPLASPGRDYRLLNTATALADWGLGPDRRDPLYEYGKGGLSPRFNAEITGAVFSELRILYVMLEPIANSDHSVDQFGDRAAARAVFEQELLWYSAKTELFLAKSLQFLTAAAHAGVRGASGQITDAQELNALADTLTWARLRLRNPAYDGDSRAGYIADLQMTAAHLGVNCEIHKGDFDQLDVHFARVGDYLKIVHDLIRERANSLCGAHFQTLRGAQFDFAGESVRMQVEKGALQKCTPGDAEDIAHHVAFAISRAGENALRAGAVRVFKYLLNPQDAGIEEEPQRLQRIAREFEGEARIVEGLVRPHGEEALAALNRYRGEIDLRLDGFKAVIRRLSGPIHLP